jgi:hypothetical protein
MTFITEIEKINPNIHMEEKKPMNSQGKKRGTLEISQYLTSNYARES